MHRNANPGPVPQGRRGTGLRVAGAALFFLAFSGNSVFAETPKDVTVVGPVGVHRLDNPVLTMILESGTVEVEDGFVGAVFVPVGAVPEGTRMAIEQVTVHCSTPPGNRVNTAFVYLSKLNSPTSSSQRAFQIPLIDQGTDGFGNAIYAGALGERLFTERGLIDEGLEAGVVRADATGESSCFFAFTGYTVPLEPGAGAPLLAAAEEEAIPLSQVELRLTPAEAMHLEDLDHPPGTMVKLLAP